MCVLTVLAMMAIFMVLPGLSVWFATDGLSDISDFLNERQKRKIIRKNEKAKRNKS